MNISGLVLLLLGSATIAATLLALVVSSVAVPIRQRLDGPPAARDPSASAASDLSARRRATVAAIAVFVVGLNLTTVSEYTSTENGPPTETGPVLTAPPAATSPQVRRAQLSAWIVYGGDALLLSLPDSLQEFAAGLRRIGRGDRSGTVSASSGCTHIIDWATRANSYFTIPDPARQTDWEEALTLAATGGAACLEALDAGDDTALANASTPLIEAGQIINSIQGSITQQLTPENGVPRR